MKVEELMGSLRTFELNQQIRQKGKPNALKEKSVALKSSKKKDSDENDGEDEMALLTKNFQKYIKKIGNKKPTFKSSKGNHFSKHFDNSNKRGIQWRECEGFGHIQSECANTLKKNKKVMVATWSDHDSESNDEEDNSNLVLTSVVSGLTLNSQVKKRFVCLNNTVHEQNSECECSESDLDEDSLKESYKDMNDQWLKVCSDNRLMVSNNKSLQKRNNELENTVKNLEKKVIAKDCEIKRLSNEINHMVKGVKMLNPNSRILDDVIVAGQQAITSPLTDATKLQSVPIDLTQTEVLRSNKSGHFVPICHFCGVRGHIRPRCDISILTHFKSSKCGAVTFGDGIAGNIVGKGTLNLDGLPKLRNFFLVEGIKANLISISQICDQGFTINFSHDYCNVVDQTGTSKTPYEIWKVKKKLSVSETVVTETESVATTSGQTVKEDPEMITDSIQRKAYARVKKNHLTNLILGNIEDSMVTRRRYVNLVQFVYFTSSFEPKNVKEALCDESKIEAMQEELE
ncbi:uncharacterized protein LOC133800375 [Humulus lupulus]|uniref:uncharacterized protein LOC133800375 n=1 Tax=Humulus lupulus TaxID=3486 RepID=UPI002B412419|nr:uncharacterized protein LOC133800375 [Humulus lupulus]